MKRWQGMGLILLILMVVGVDALCGTDDYSVRKVLENPKYYGFVDPMQTSEMMLQEAMSLDADLDISPNYEGCVPEEKGDVVYARVARSHVVKLIKSEKENTLNSLKGGEKVSAIIIVSRVLTIREMLNIFESGVNVLSNFHYSYLIHGRADAVRDISEKDNVRLVAIYNSQHKDGFGSAKSPVEDSYTVRGLKVDMAIVERDLAKLGVKIESESTVGERYTEFTLVVSGEYENVQALLDLPWVFTVYPPSPADELMGKRSISAVLTRLPVVRLVWGFRRTSLSRSWASVR